MISGQEVWELRTPLRSLAVILAAAGTAGLHAMRCNAMWDRWLQPQCFSLPGTDFGP